MLAVVAAALPFFARIMPRGTITSGDRRFNVSGDEVVLVHHYATAVPRQSLWSVVDYTNEIKIVDFGPKGPKMYRSRKAGVVGRDAKRFTQAEWAELLRRSREMSAVAPADFAVKAFAIRMLWMRVRTLARKLAMAVAPRSEAGSLSLLRRRRRAS